MAFHKGTEHWRVWPTADHAGGGAVVKVVVLWALAITASVLRADEWREARKARALPIQTGIDVVVLTRPPHLRSPYGGGDRGNGSESAAVLCAKAASRTAWYLISRQ